MFFVGPPVSTKGIAQQNVPPSCTPNRTCLARSSDLPVEQPVLPLVYHAPSHAFGQFPLEHHRRAVQALFESRHETVPKQPVPKNIRQRTSGNTRPPSSERHGASQYRLGNYRPSSSLLQFSCETVRAPSF